MKKSPIVKVIKKVLPGVVSIVERDKNNQGTGFIARKTGIVLTNSHIVSNPQGDYAVILNDGRELKGKVLLVDPLTDIAILKIPGKNLPFLRLGDSSKIELGEDVLAIGNVLGIFRNTVSRGIISGLFRDISAQESLVSKEKHLRGLIQTDAAVNPGNSGGPLINLKGEVIGINVASVLQTENIGFAIPINTAKKELTDIKKFGRIRRPFVGIKYLPINEQVKKRLNLPVSYGVYILDLPDAIIKNSPADKSGLKQKDIILECNKQKITPEVSFEELLQEISVNQEIELTILRKNKKLKKKIKLEEKQNT